MKNKFIVVYMLSFIIAVDNLFAQSFPAKENGCFQYFNNDAVTRDNVNAYFLSYMSRYVYVDYLNKDNGYNIRPTDSTRFRDKYIERTRHFFNPVMVPIKGIQPKVTIDNKNIQKISPIVVKPNVEYEWVWRSDGQGKNPEAMIISTPQTILVVFRGTDRVDGGRSAFDYQWGEWLYTDFKIFGARPCNTCNVKVHAGFMESLNYSGFKNHLINSMRRFGVANKKVWITGHSLGGGMAQLFAYLLKKTEDIDVQGVYVYNSPHPGDVSFANDMNDIIGRQRIQRFEFLDDPISSGPPQTINWIPGLPVWGRAGTRNWFSKESTGGFQPNIREKQPHEDLSTISVVGTALFGGLCFHHPTWITRGVHNLLSADMQSKLPNPPARISAADEGCNTVDINNGISGRLHDAGTDIVPAGTYTIKNVYSDRFLRMTTACGINGCCDLLQNNSGTGNAARWRFTKVPNAIFESYTITSAQNGKVIDADVLFTGTNECKVHLCNRLPLGVLRTNQEWRLTKLPNGNYRIKCVAGERYLRVSPNCSSQDGCRFELHSQTTNVSEWQLTKVD